MKYPYAVKIDDKIYKAGEDVPYSRKFITKLFDVTKSTILPKLFLIGDTTGISKNNAVKMTADYIFDDFSFVNPVKIYKTYRVNYFGTAHICIIYNLLCPVGSTGYWIYKICTVGRKK